jgi:hypothetical protein
VQRCDSNFLKGITAVGSLYVKLKACPSLDGQAVGGHGLLHIKQPGQKDGKQQKDNALGFVADKFNVRGDWFFGSGVSHAWPLSIKISAATLQAAMVCSVASFSRAWIILTVSVMAWWVVALAPAMYASVRGWA